MTLAFDVHTSELERSLASVGFRLKRRWELVPLFASVSGQAQDLECLRRLSCVGSVGIDSTIAPPT